ncbi:hypothetical protein LOAG_09660 [Loa loa]|uniref:Uncharacterized protein n=1 Tax=Loa loa TaxID=7209 RepID=A0A1S0TRG0_LOALO|nr:hypothetical protein LOAG_09660 [Loa loa]EFO18836.2 hypothetical protein LOAG_09660 [Loa loa]
MDGCTAGALGLLLVAYVLHSHSHGTKGYAPTFLLMALSYAIFNLSAWSGITNETTYFITSTSTKKPEIITTRSVQKHQKIITSKSMQTSLAFTTGKEISNYVTNSSLPNTQVMKTDKKEVQMDGLNIFETSEKVNALPSLLLGKISSEMFITV